MPLHTHSLLVMAKQVVLDVFLCNLGICCNNFLRFDPSESCVVFLL